MKPIEELAMMQAVANVINDQLKRENPNSLRAQLDEQYRSLYEETGVRSRDVKIGGMKVGTYSAVISKPIEPREVEEFTVYDNDALAQWVDTLSIDDLRHFVALHLREFAESFFFETGEIPDGCELIKVYEPGTDEVFKGTRLKVDPVAVSDAIRALPDAQQQVQRMLLGGE